MRKFALALAFALLAGGAVLAEKNVSFGLGLVSDKINFENSGSELSFSYSNLGFSMDVFSSSSGLPLGFMSGVSFAILKDAQSEFAGKSSTFDDLTSSFAMDSLFGLGYIIAPDSPFSAIVGGGVAMTLCAIKNDAFTFSNIGLGFGGSVTARYSFIPGLGVSLVLRDEYCPSSLISSYNTRYDITDIKDDFKNANSLSVTGGIAFSY